MASNVTYNSFENDDRTRLLDNYHYLAERRCLKQRLTPTPLGIRRSISLEDNSTDLESNNLSPKINEQYSSTLLPSRNPQLSTSLTSLCLKLRRHQLLPEYNPDMEKSAVNNEFNWSHTLHRLRTLLERVILMEYKKKYYYPQTYENENDLKYHLCQRRGRRNAVCLGIDRLYYNDQMLLFASVANEVQMDFHLVVSGFKL